MPKLHIRVFFEPRDIWIGIYWKRQIIPDYYTGATWEIYIYLLPCLPIHIRPKVKGY